LILHSRFGAAQRDGSSMRLPAAARHAERLARIQFSSLDR
jgi:hypothetical protein